MRAYHRLALRLAFLCVMILGVVAMLPSRAHALDCRTDCFNAYHTCLFECAEPGVVDVGACRAECLSEYNDCLSGC